MRHRKLLVWLLAGCLSLGIMGCAKNPKPMEQAQQPQKQDRYCLWLLWLKTDNLVDQVSKRLAKGENFVLVSRDMVQRYPGRAAEQAECLESAQLDPEVLQAASQLKLGQVSQPLSLRKGKALVMLTTDQHRRKGYAFFKAGLYKEAEKELRQDLKLHPTSATSWHFLARSLAATGKLTEALAAFDQAQRWDPQQPSHYYYKGLALEKAGQDESALAQYRRALALAPDDPIVMSHLAVALAQRGRELDLAEELARRATELAPNQAAAWSALGQVQRARGKSTAAVVSFHWALSIDPESTGNQKLLLDSMMALDTAQVSRLYTSPGRKRIKSSTLKKSKAKPRAKAGSKPKAQAEPKPAAAPQARVSLLRRLEPQPQDQPPREKKAPEKDKAKTAPKDKTKDKAPAKPAPEIMAKLETGPAQGPQPVPAAELNKAKPAAKEQEEARPKDVAKDMAKQQPKPVAMDQAKDKPKDTPKDEPKKKVKEIAKDLAKDQPLPKDKAKAPQDKPKAPAELKPAKVEKAVAKTPAGSIAKADKATGPKPKKEPPAKTTKAPKTAKKEAAPKAAKALPIEKKPKPEPKATSKAKAKEGLKDKPQMLAKASQPQEGGLDKAKPKAEAKDQPKDLAKPKPRDKTLAVKEPPKASATAVKEPKAVEGEKQTYLLQVSSNRNIELARREVNRWSKKGQNAQLESWRTPRQGLWYRVLLGPFASYKQALTLGRDLKKQKAIRSYVVISRPANP